MVTRGDGEYGARARDVADAVDHSPPRLGATQLIAIDGPAGSGKTTLARDVAAELTGLSRRTATVHLDDLYEGWAGLDDALERRVCEQLLVPLSAGNVARWQRYDWLAGRFAEWHELPPPEVLILEGCGAGARAYSAYTSLLVWLDADRDTRIARGLTRDGPQVLAKWLAWMDTEAEHFAVNWTRGRADIRFRTG